MNTAETYMRRALELASDALGQTAPNPMVGAVIVCDEQIIGEGYHEHYGQAHAEVNAINQVTERYANAAELLRRSQLFVTLEPCAHQGKTPPCADLIIKHQVPEVYIGSIDPFEQVNGKGIEKLTAAGIRVHTGILKEACDELNKRFFTYHRKQRPYIILKWAESADGFIAPENKEPYWLSSPTSRKLVHKWRSEEQAILVGTQTAAKDNPRLDTRLWNGRNPLRLVIDRHLSLSPGLHLFDQSQPTIVFNEHKTAVQEQLTFVQIDFYGYVPQLIAYQLYLKGIQSLIVEGGAHTLNEFIRHNLWDEARVFSTPKPLHAGLSAPVLPASQQLPDTFVEDDRLQIYRNPSA